MHFFFTDCICMYSLQNTNKKNQIDQLETQKLEEKTRIIENKLYTAEQNREKEIQKKIEKVQKLVGVTTLSLTAI